jgi:predicted permease
MLSDMWMRIRAVVRWGRVEGEMEDELRFDFEQRVEKYVRAGMAREEATRRARLEFGGAEQIKEECREARGVQFFETFAQDLRYTLRMLARDPGFTTVALLTLALGIGATTVMFTLVSGVLLKPLPYGDPGSLVAVHGQAETWSTAAYGEQNVANPDFRDCQRENRTLELAGALFDDGTVDAPGEPEHVDLRAISSGFFSVLGVPLAHGREFLPEEDRAGAAPVTILGYGFWQRHFGGRTDALGESVTLNEKRYTVVGIAPAGFQFYGAEANVYTPLGQDTDKFLQNRAAHPICVVGRLRPGATLGQAKNDIALIGESLAKQFADTNKGRSLVVEPLRPDVSDVRSTLWLLLGAVGLVLLIACVNVASLLLARAVSRERELAMRAALGASKSRLVRQCLTESAVLGISGGALGVMLAYLGVQPFVALWPGTLPRAGEVQVDWRVLLFAVAASLLSGVLFGLAPAVRAPTRGLERALRAGARTVAGSSRGLHSAFVVSEISLAMVLLVGAGMLGRTLLRVSSLNPGLDIHNLLVTRVAPSPALMNDPGKLRAAWEAMLQSASHVPGVRAVAAVDTVPMREGNNQLGYWPSADVPPENKQPLALATSVTPDYFKAMGIPLHRGRMFTAEDRMGTEPVVVIDDVLARDAFGKQDPVGQRLWIPDMGYGPLTVVGVVGHVRHWGLASDDQAIVRAQFYYPFAQLPDRFVPRWSQLMSIVVRTDVDPLSAVPALRRAARAVASDQVLYEVRTMEQLAHETLALHRFLLALFGIFAGLALLLACIGIYGVLSYLTAQRVPEIGVRMALGATHASILQMILRQSLAIICVGVGLGLIGAVLAARVLEHVVDGMRPLDALTLAITILVLAGAAIFASFVPARRASRVDPMVALRQE